MTAYQDFLASKRLTAPPTGIEPGAVNPMLFGFQRAIVQWALRRGRAAVFADCGLGKTPMQLEWASQIPGDVLILAPLGVTQQTVDEGRKFGVPVAYCRDGDDVQPGITITNYEMLPHFDADRFAGVVLDESSILKHYDSKFRNLIISSFAQTPYKLPCTATPAPNDYMELGNHAEFLGVMSRTEMLSMFFVHDGGDTSKWRIKGHAQREFWKWVCSWAVLIRKPSDLGFQDEGFILPACHTREIQVDVERHGSFLMPIEARTLQERIAARRDSIGERVKACADLCNGNDEQWIVWCNLNDEADELELQISGGVQVKGSHKPEHKAEMARKFVTGEVRCLITKASIFGMGLNWQHCRNAAFVGLSDSWEDYYQSVRRIWRFGQKSEVNVYLITSKAEGAVLANIKRKEADAEIMANEMVKEMSEIEKVNVLGVERTENAYERDCACGDKWELHLGDCVEVAREIATESVDFSVFSPPFASLYTYSASDRDMGNCKNDSAFKAHFAFLITELFRVTKPGRLVSFHCMNLPTTKSYHGYIGIRDFRGDLIKMFEAAGFIYHSEACIWKDPVTAMQRTKALGLLHKQVVKDSCMSRQGLPDYLVTMRKPGENPNRVAGCFNHYTGDNWPPLADEGAPKEPDYTTDADTRNGYSIAVWQRYASPVWMDINPSDTLQRRSAREEADEKHICPLQLQVIERALALWSNPGDLVLSPFTGIGSEGYVALEKGRRFIGIELKRSYWTQAKANLAAAVNKCGQTDLF